MEEKNYQHRKICVDRTTKYIEIKQTVLNAPNVCEILIIHNILYCYMNFLIVPKAT